MRFRKVLIGIFMVGILCCGIGAGVMFQEYSSFEYMGEKKLGGNKTAEKTILENLYTNKDKAVNASFITINNTEEDNVKLKTSKAIPKDKVQIKVRYNSDNVKDIHIDRNLYNDDEYIEGDEYESDNMDEVAAKTVQEDTAKANETNPISQEFFISVAGRMSSAEIFLTYKDEILKNIKEQKIYNYVYPQIISVEITVNPENKDMIEV